MLPVLSGTGRLTHDPELKISLSGATVTKVRLAFNSRKKDGDKWVDDKAFYVTGILFGDHADHVATSLSKGDEVVVTGRLVTRSWETETNDKRSMTELMVDSIGPSLRFVQAKPKRLDRHHEPAATDDKDFLDEWTKPIDESSVSAVFGV